MAGASRPDATQVVAVAREVLRDRGVLGLTLEEVANRLRVDISGVTAHYAHLDDLYDALFADGHRILAQRFAAVPVVDDPRERVRLQTHAFVRFAVEDAGRHQLLFQRLVPDFEPSPASYALAVENLDRSRKVLEDVGITESAHVDMLTAITGGMVNQQLANDPGGDRWLRLIDDTLDIYLDMRDGRRRLVAAQDRERRRIERDLHDGVQQQLIGLRIAAAAARAAAAAESATDTAAVLTTFEDEISVAIRTLRELAHGIYPPLLAAEGVPAALRAAATRSPFVVDVIAEDLGRYDEDIEAAMYFCCLEALQNIAKYASATAVTITIGRDDRSLSFSVRDDGCGFDLASTPRGAGTVNMADRVAALGGQLSIDSLPGRGTTVLGRIPVRSRESRIGAISGASAGSVDAARG
jgi:signal transduction histidine kinase